MRINNCADLARFRPFYVPILAKAFSGKHECPKKGHAAPDPSPVAPPENGKTFVLKTRMPRKGTIAICQNVNNI